MVGTRTRPDGDGVAVQGIGAKLCIGVVPGTAEVACDVVRGERLAGADLARRCIDLRGAGKERATAEPFIDDMLVLVVVIAKDERAHQQSSQADDNDEQQGSLPQGATHPVPAHSRKTLPFIAEPEFYRHILLARAFGLQHA